MDDPDHFIPPPKGDVEFVENPLTPSARTVRCHLGAAPAWVQAKHAKRDADPRPTPTPEAERK